MVVSKLLVSSGHQGSCPPFGRIYPADILREELPLFLLYCLVCMIFVFLFIFPSESRYVPGLCPRATEMPFIPSYSLEMSTVICLGT